MTNKEIKDQKTWIDIEIGGLELRLAMSHGISDTDKQSILDKISTLRSKRLALSAFRLS